VLLNKNVSNFFFFSKNKKTNNNMPYTIKKISPLCYSVVNTQTGEVKSKCSTLEDAEKQRRALYGLETGWKPALSFTDFLKRGSKRIGLKE